MNSGSASYDYAWNMASVLCVGFSELYLRLVLTPSLISQVYALSMSLEDEDTKPKEKAVAQKPKSRV